MESIKKPLAWMLLSLLILLLLFYGGRSILFKRVDRSTIFMRNFAPDSVAFGFECDSLCFDDNFFGVNKSDNCEENYSCKSAILLTSQDAERIKALITNTINHLFNTLLAEEHLSADYETIEIDSLYEKYYYYGKLQLHPNVKSYVFLKNVDKKLTVGAQELWLFNVKNGVLLSVSSLFSKVTNIFPTGKPTDNYVGSFRENNVFVQFSNDDKEKIEELFLNNQSLEETKKKLRDIYCDLYVVNENGYIEIIKPSAYHKLIPRYEWMYWFRQGNVIN